jgi:hypothetical protein
MFIAAVVAMLGDSDALPVASRQATPCSRLNARLVVALRESEGPAFRCAAAWAAGARAASSRHKRTMASWALLRVGCPCSRWLPVPVVLVLEASMSATRKEKSTC